MTASPGASPAGLGRYSQQADELSAGDLNGLAAIEDYGACRGAPRGEVDMLSLVVGILFVLWFLVLITVGIRSHRKQKQRSAGKFDSVAPAVGFQSREINPRPPGSLTGVVESSIPIVRAFGRARRSSLRWGNAGETGREGTRLGVDVPHSRRFLESPIHRVCL